MAVLVVTTVPADLAIVGVSTDMIGLRLREDQREPMHDGGCVRGHTDQIGDPFPESLASRQDLREIRVRRLPPSRSLHG